MEPFVHLHVHTQYSLLDGQASVKKLVDKAIKDGMKGMAITDHGNMFAIKEFFNYVKGLKKKDPDLDFMPIFGCEMYCARRGMLQKEGKIDQRGWHLILLAKNERGYHNLIKMQSHAWVDGFYGTARIDHAELEKYHEDIIACSACLAGEVPSYILKGDLEKAEESLRWFKNLFGEDYYLELQRHEVKNPDQRANRETYPLQQQVNAELIRLAKKYDVKLICTNDVHFVDEENAEAHDRLICLATGKDLDDPTRMLYSKQEWFKTQQEMNDIFSDVPEALSNTLEVLQKVSSYNIDHAPIMPNFAIPESFGTEAEYRSRITEKELYDEFTQDENGNVVLSEEEGKKKIARLGGYDKLYRIKFEADYLASLTYERAVKIYGDPLPQHVAEQIKFELHIMKTMGFPGYFLIVQDYINAAREKLGVWVGPGRGSAAGSTVAYCLGITRIDPIKYDLLFERFLNPDRISLPDIDVDFDDDGRGKVLLWVTEKYGAERVAHIITYGTMATKQSIKDVARVQKVPLDVVNAICKAIPDHLPNGKKMSIANALDYVKELKDAATNPDPKLRDTIRYAMMLENNIRQTGVHACGTIICRDDISDWVPVSTADDKEYPGTRLRCTQYDGHVIEETGLIKMDFLGLTTLSILKEAVQNIKESKGLEIDVEKIPIDDPDTYKLYQEGRTIGTFQFESSGMQKYLRELKPTVFEDLIAMNALYRPGPMDYIPQFIARKNGLEPIVYDIPCMEKYLKDTYGITVYQEQVMLLSRQLANFTRGESDALRKAMGKKKKDIVDAMKPKFIEGGKKNGHDSAVLEKIWADWEKFASYAFNKSHATCYSWVAYQTAYLKAHYPAEYMAGVMTRSGIEKVPKLMDECRSMGIDTKGPDVNESRLKFSVDSHGAIRFGLSLVKGVSTSGAEDIISERKKNGKYESVFDFFERLNYANCNRKTLENIIVAGGLDSLPIEKGGTKCLPRETYFTVVNGHDTYLETLIRYGQKVHADKQMSTNTLFGDLTQSIQIEHPRVPENVELWNDLERLNRERELVGIYLTAHPLDPYAVIIKYVCSVRLPQLGENPEELAKMEAFSFGGIVTNVRQGTTKNGKPYAIVRMEDFTGSGEIPLFGQNYIQWLNHFTVGTALFIKARMEPRRYDPSRLDLHLQEIQYLVDVKDTLVHDFSIEMPLDQITPQFVDDLQELTSEKKGNVTLHLRVSSPKGFSLPFRAPYRKIAVHNSLLEYLESNPNIKYKVN